MDELITHLVSAFVKHPQDIEHQVISKKATLIVELKLHEEDKESFSDEQRFSVQHVLSLASGNKKPVVELVEELSDLSIQEESSDVPAETNEESAESEKSSDSSSESEESSEEE
jgi:hypothetical protein